MSDLIGFWKFATNCSDTILRLKIMQYHHTLFSWTCSSWHHNTRSFGPMFAPQQAEVLLAFPCFIEPSEIFIADSGKIIPGIVVGNAQGGGYN